MSRETPEEKKAREQKTLEQIKKRIPLLKAEIEAEKARIPNLEKRKTELDRTVHQQFEAKKKAPDPHDTGAKMTKILRKQQKEVEADRKKLHKPGDARPGTGAMILTGSGPSKEEYELRHVEEDLRNIAGRIRTYQQTIKRLEQTERSITGEPKLEGTLTILPYLGFNAEGRYLIRQDPEKPNVYQVCDVHGHPQDHHKIKVDPKTLLPTRLVIGYLRGRERAYDLTFDANNIPKALKKYFQSRGTKESKKLLKEALEKFQTYERTIADLRKKLDRMEKGRNALREYIRLHTKKKRKWNPFSR